MLAAVLGAGPAHAGYANPVASELPDPAVLRGDDGTFWAYGTGDRFPILRSRDLVRWTPAGRALPERPAWATTASEWHPWAPGIVRREAPCPGRASGPCHVLFITALEAVTTTNCIGVATSPTPAGPFTDHGILRDTAGATVGCGDAAGRGYIDPQPFVDADGRAYLLLSVDAVCEPTGCPLRPTISIIPLAGDLATAAGPRRPLLSGRPGTWEDAPWAAVVENPFVVRRGETYHLLFSGGAWDGRYAMGHATAPSPTGPFVRSDGGEPLLEGTSDVAGPGGGSLTTGPGGGEWLVYHGRTPGSRARDLRIDPLGWVDERPVLLGPTAGPVGFRP